MMFKKIVDGLNAHESGESLIHLLDQVQWPLRIKRVATDLFKFYRFQQSDAVTIFRNLSNRQKGSLDSASDLAIKHFGVLHTG